MTDYFAADSNDPSGLPPLEPAEPLETTEPGTRTERRALRTRRRLLGAALTLFTERGLDATTIEEITERADVGKGTFYRHFSSKEELAVALMGDVVDRLDRALHATRRPRQSVQEVLERLFEIHARLFMNHRESFLLLFQGRLLLKLQGEAMPELKEHFERYVREIGLQLQPFLPEASGASAERLRTLALAVAGMISGFFSFAMIGVAPEELRANLKPLRHAFVSGCKAYLAERA